MTTATAIAPSGATLTIPTELFGTLELGADDLTTFTGGLPGFPSCRQWVFIPGAKSGTAWLQSAERPGLSFLLVDPFEYFDAYAVELSDDDMRRVAASSSTDVAVFAIVTLPGARGEDASANLQGPVLFNFAQRRGAQVVLEEGRWTVRETLPIAKLS